MNASDSSGAQPRSGDVDSPAPRRDAAAEQPAGINHANPAEVADHIARHIPGGRSERVAVRSGTCWQVTSCDPHLWNFQIGGTGDGELNWCLIPAGKIGSHGGWTRNDTTTARRDIGRITAALTKLSRAGERARRRQQTAVIGCQQR